VPGPETLGDTAGLETEIVQTGAITLQESAANLATSGLAHRLRAVHRAASDLKRGTPVILTGDVPLLLLPAETAGARGLAELAAMADGPAVLLLAPARAEAVLKRLVRHEPSQLPGPAVAIQLPDSLIDPVVLLSLADPTVTQLLPDPALPAVVPELAAAALALVKLARLLPAAVVAPARNDVVLCDDLDLLRVSAEDVMAYPGAMASSLVRVAEARVPLEDCDDTRVVAFRAPDAGIEHLAILVGRPEVVRVDGMAPLVRIHSECFTGDLLGSLRCDCGPQLRGAISRMAADGGGVLLYLAQEGRGIGLVNKLRAYAMQDRGLDTLDANRALGWGADERNFLVAATMLDQLGIHRVRLLTNNPDKVAALTACGVDVVTREKHAFAPNGVNDGYLATKEARFGHMLG
jgi:GTP cyclohydrolase II